MLHGGVHGVEGCGGGWVGCGGQLRGSCGLGVGVVCVVALAMAEGVVARGEMNGDGAVAAILFFVGGGVGEGVVVGAVVDGFVDRAAEVVGVEIGFAAGGVGDATHGAVVVANLRGGFGYVTLDGAGSHYVFIGGGVGERELVRPRESMG